MLRWYDEKNINLLSDEWRFTRDGWEYEGLFMILSIWRLELTKSQGAQVYEQHEKRKQLGKRMVRRLHPIKPWK